jgi:hypothetical protein
MTHALLLLLVVVAQASPTGGKWKVTTTKDPMNDKPVVTASLAAEEQITGWPGRALPQLIVRCQTPLTVSELQAKLAGSPIPYQPGLDVYLAMGMPAIVENAEKIHAFDTRFDELEADVWRTGESPDGKAFFLSPVQSAQLLFVNKRLAESRRFIVRFTPFNSTPVVVTFDTRGFASHVDRIVAACPAVDRTTWK